MAYQIVNPRVSKHNNIVTITLTLQYVDDVTNEVVEKRDFSARINWKREDAKTLILEMLKSEAAIAKAEIDEYIQLKTVAASMIEEIKKDLGV